MNLRFQDRDISGFRQSRISIQNDKFFSRAINLCESMCVRTDFFIKWTNTLFEKNLEEKVCAAQ